MNTGEVPPTTNSPGMDRAWRTVLWWIVAGALWRATLGILVPPLPDETYYWEWTRHLQLSYFDHPPVIALLIRAGTLVFGDSTLGIRAGPALAGVLSSVCVAMLARNLAGPMAAARAAVISAVLPMATLGLVLATPDSPLMAVVSFSLFALERALASPLRSSRALGWWLAAGAGIGVAMDTKYTAVLLPFSFLVAALLHPALRRRFAEPGPWLAGVLALALFTPVVLWNAQNNWVSFRFQLDHGFGQASRGTSISRELEYIGGQVGLASPVLFVLLVMAVGQALRALMATRAQQPDSTTGAANDVSARRFALAMTSLVPAIFFGISAWRRPVEANWPALMYPAAMVLLATATSPWAVRRTWKVAIGFALALCIGATLQAWRPLLPIEAPRDPIGRAHGWDTLGDVVNTASKDPFLASSQRRWIAATRYEVSSEIAFHLQGQPHVHCLWLDGRPNQYDFWPTFFNQAKTGDGMVVVFDADAHGDAQADTVGTWFESRRLFTTVDFTRGRGVIKRRSVWMYRNALRVPDAAARLPSAWVAR